MKAALAFVVLLAAVGIYMAFFYPPITLKRTAEAVLMQFAEDVASQDRARITQSLQALLAENAKVHLEVSFMTLLRQNPAPAMVQDYSKAEFIALVDHTLTPLTEYVYQPRLEGFTLADDEKTAEITFTSKQYADGSSLYGTSTVAMRHSADMQCTATVSFEKNIPRLIVASCNLQLRSVPKPGEAQKIQNNPGALQQLLQEQR
jgi:hypothetical protein